MSRAAKRRKKAQREFLAGLAKAEPDRFCLEWAKRLQSWALQGWRNAGRLTSSSVFQIIEWAVQELKEIGPEAQALQESHTRKMLHEELTHALSAAIDPNLRSTPFWWGAGRQPSRPNWVQAEFRAEWIFDLDSLE